MNREKERQASETGVRGRDVIRIASLAFTRRGRDLAARTGSCLQKGPRQRADLGKCENYR